MVTGMSLSAKNYQVEESDVDYWMNQFDEDKGGSIGEDEFVRGMSRWASGVSFRAPSPPLLSFLSFNFPYLSYSAFFSLIFFPLFCLHRRFFGWKGFEASGLQGFELLMPEWEQRSSFSASSVC